jgi:hypothetical protein
MSISALPLPLYPIRRDDNGVARIVVDKLSSCSDQQGFLGSIHRCSGEDGFSIAADHAQERLFTPGLNQRWAIRGAMVEGQLWVRDQIVGAYP